jgi:DNA-binding transcriptional LysR family regulator
MNLDGIDVFVKVVQVGSFSGAAKILSMPVTTASGKVAALEKRLGTTLIHRTTRKLNVTQAGEAFFQRCVKALDEIVAGENELDTVKAGPEGLLRITTVADVGNILLPRYIDSYLKKYPKMSVELILTNRVVDLVGEGVDLAIRVGKLKDSTMISKRFLETKGGLVATPGYLKKYGIPLNPRDLKKHQFIKFSSGFSPLTLTNGKEHFELTPTGRIMVDDMQASKAFVLQGEGIGMLPSFLCEQELKNKKLVKITPSWNWNIYFTLSFVYPAQRFVSPKVQSFIEWCSKN